jgi:uroporphyrinogen decarboxylase
VTRSLLRALSGEPVWPPPIWLMRQAGRYLPEYRALRATVPDFITLCTSPALATELTLQPIRRYRFDAAILFSDILLLPWAMGQGLEYRQGEGPVLPPIRDEAAFNALDPSRLAEKTEPVMAAVRQIRVALTSEGFDSTALIGFAGAPFTVACYMVEGSGSRDFTETRTLAYQNPTLFNSINDSRRRRNIDAVRHMGWYSGARTVSPLRDQSGAAHRIDVGATISRRSHHRISAPGRSVN